MIALSKEIVYNKIMEVHMKKRIVFLGLLFLCLFGCSKSTYNEITYQELKNMVEQKESFVLFIGAESCSHCKNYKTTINQVIKEYKVDIKYIDIDKLTEEENSYLNNLVSYRGTPTTVFITKGQEESSYNRISGDHDYDYVVNKLEKNGYIKKVK